MCTQLCGVWGSKALASCAVPVIALQGITSYKACHAQNQQHAEAQPTSSCGLHMHHLATRHSVLSNGSLLSNGSNYFETDATIQGFL
jgi:hypothetical protein